MTQQANRAGRPWQRKDGRWAARAYPPDVGKPKMVYGGTEAEVIERQYEAEVGHAPLSPEAAAIIEGTTPAQRRIREALKPKTTRITVDLDQEAYAALNQWLGTAAAEVGAPVSKARALRAMIRAVSLDKSIGLVVIDLLRRDS